MKVLPGISVTDTIIRFGNDSDLKYQHSFVGNRDCLHHCPRRRVAVRWLSGTATLH